MGSVWMRKKGFGDGWRQEKLGIFVEKNSFFFFFNLLLC